MKTSELSGAALDWAVANAFGRKMQRNPMGPQSGHGWWIWEETPSGLGGVLLDKSIYMEIGPRIHPKTRQSKEKFSPSTDWSQGGPIIERARIQVSPSRQWLVCPADHKWIAARFKSNSDSTDFQHSPTPLIAAMRCYVASKLGDNVEIPGELNAPTI